MLVTVSLPEDTFHWSNIDMEHPPKCRSLSKGNRSFSISSPEIYCRVSSFLRPRNLPVGLTQRWSFLLEIESLGKYQILIQEKERPVFTYFPESSRSQRISVFQWSKKPDSHISSTQENPPAPMNDDFHERKLQRLVTDDRWEPSWGHRVGECPFSHSILRKNIQ